MQIGLQFGGSNYHGDLANEIVPGETHLMAGIFVKRNMSSHFATSLQFSYGKISGTDENFDNYAWRNLSFYSSVFELSFLTEFNFQPYGVNVLDKRFTPYLFTGFSLFAFNPKADYNGEEQVLRDLGTEGQLLDGGPKKYKLIQPAIPMGMGIKYNLTHHLEIGFRVGFRKTFTDYLDDVSTEYPDFTVLSDQAGNASAWLSHREIENGFSPVNEGTMRGDPNLKDWYLFGGITIAYRFIPSIQCHNLF
jgi:hypothetical protein